MNAYEIEQIEKQMKAGIRLPLSYQDWADVARRARQERDRVMGKAIADFFTAAFAKITGAARQMRTTAAECSAARLRHDH